jgi:hypothetical protein
VCSALPCRASVAGEANANKRPAFNRYYGIG